MVRAWRGGGWGEDSIFWWEARDRFVGEISRGFDADGKRIRKKVYGRTKTEVRDKLKELKRELDAQLRPWPSTGKVALQGFDA